MGYIIVIEGTDGSGKKTQADRLYQRLMSEGYDVMKASFPNYDSRSSGPVKMYLDGEFGDSDMCLDAYQSSLFYTVDRVCTYNKDLKAHYERGGIVVLDRYVSSNMLHQSCKIDNLEERDKYLDWLDNLEFGLMKLPRPNRMIFLDMPVEYSHKLAVARGAYKTGDAKDIHESSTNHLERAYNAGKYVADKYNWTTIDCIDKGELRTIDSIHEEIYNAVIDDLRKLKN